MTTDKPSRPSAPTPSDVPDHKTTISPPVAKLPPSWQPFPRMTWSSWIDSTFTWIFTGELTSKDKDDLPWNYIVHDNELICLMTDSLHTGCFGANAQEPRDSNRRNIDGHCHHRVHMDTTKLTWTYCDQAHTSAFRILIIREGPIVQWYTPHTVGCIEPMFSLDEKCQSLYKLRQQARLQMIEDIMSDTHRLMIESMSFAQLSKRLEVYSLQWFADDSTSRSMNQQSLELCKQLQGNLRVGTITSRNVPTVHTTRGRILVPTIGLSEYWKPLQNDILPIIEKKLST